MNMFYALMCVLGLVAIAFVLAMTSAARANWRLCMRCNRYFDNEGNTSSYPPVGTKRIRDGVCLECSRDLEFSAMYKEAV